MNEGPGQMGQPAQAAPLEFVNQAGISTGQDFAVLSLGCEVNRVRRGGPLEFVMTIHTLQAMARVFADAVEAHKQQTSSIVVPFSRES